MEASAVNGIWPPALASIIASAPGAYGKLAGTFVLSSVVYGVVVTIAGLTLGQVPLVGSFLVGVVSNLLLLAQALLVGRFLQRHGTELGFG